MALALSTWSAPGWTAAEVLEACTLKGFAGVELASLPDAPFVLAEAARWAEAAGSRGVRLVGIRPGTLAESFSDAAAVASARLGVPILAPAEAGTAALTEAAGRFARAGGRLLADAAGTLEGAEALARLAADLPALGVCWEVAPEAGAAASAGDFIRVLQPVLGCVRLRGGGPEVMEPSTAGTGEIMLRLTLARFAGPVVIVPSAPRYEATWKRWLGRRAGSGCGTRHGQIPILAK